MDIDEQNHAFRGLDPDSILDALESTGLRSDGRVLTLNSYENRVYQIGVDNAEPVIAKFYRPGRWSDDAIIEEHAFTLALADSEIPVVPPTILDNGQTLHHFKSHRFAVFVRRGGRTPDLNDGEQLEQLGRFVARIHAVGSEQPFAHRPQINLQTYCIDPSQYLLEHDVVPSEVRDAYEQLIQDLVSGIEACQARAGEVKQIRVHGDAHWGNILWRDGIPHIVDFDDARNAPAVQDLWMFLAGERHEQVASLSYVIDGYQQFREFDARELHLLEAMRTLRLIYFTAWIGRRWDDPMFKTAFSWFDNPGWWREHMQTLHQQLDAMQQPPLPI